MQVGPYTVFAGGTRDLREEDTKGYDVLIPLNGSLPPLGRRERVVIWSYPLQDFGGVPTDWAEFLQEVISELREGRRILAFCTGSHGRTGCFLASLVALLEPPGETHDPILAVRARHCPKAVETRAQAEAVFALRGQALWPKYQDQFRSREVAALPAAGQSWPSSPATSNRWWEDNG